jgi:transposase
MAIVGGLDIHRRQITYDWIDTDTGQARHGRIQPATRVELRAWLARLAGQQADFAFEGTTGWRFVAEEVMGAGFRAHLAEPADTRALRGPKRRAKTDRADARHLRDLLLRGALPESWIPPAHVADLRAQVRLRKALMDQRTAWHQRIHAVLYHHGLPERSWLLADEGRAWLARLELPTVARQTVDLALRTIDFLDTELDQLDATLARIARCQPGCRALMGRYGIGWLTAVSIWAEFGDVRRFANSRQAVRFTGLDITISESDGKRARGHLARQGPPVLRWALHEAAMCAARPSSPDYAYYLQVRTRLGGKRAALSVARKLAREAYHVLGKLGDQALEPVVLQPAA